MPIHWCQRASKIISPLLSVILNVKKIAFNVAFRVVSTYTVYNVSDCTESIKDTHFYGVSDQRESLRLLNVNFPFYPISSHCF